MAFGGVSVFGPTTPLVDGHRYRIAGQVQEFGGETEIVSTAFITDEGLGTVPSGVIQTVSVLRDTTTDMTGTPANPGGSTLTGEDYECMMVRIEDAQVTEDRLIGQSFFVASPLLAAPDTILISNLSGMLASYTPPPKWSRVNVQGVLHFSSGTFRICPRGPSDITSATLAVGDGNGIRQIEFSVAPNPARVSTISFALPKHDQVSLGIFDLAGRQVVELARGALPAGTYTRKWNGTDASGQRVSPGVYFYRLKVGSELRTLRSVMLQ